MANKIQAGFEEDEQVQVGENYLDKKNKQELIDLMNALFEERAKALRKHMGELMTQKVADLEDLSQEYEPQKELLKQRRANGLISDADYQSAMDRIVKEEQEKKMDIEIAYADKEKELQEDLEMAKLEAESEQKKLLKDRQTEEKVAMFKKMMESMDENDQMKQYLDQQTRDAEMERNKYSRQMEKEKQKKIDAMEEEKERKMKELEDRHERMFNWGEQVKASEDAMMEGFRRQKEDMMKKKLAEQQREILKDMNKADVDAMLEKHKRQLMMMDEALRVEQER
jgi:hypothetical protein